MTRPGRRPGARRGRLVAAALTALLAGLVVPPGPASAQEGPLPAVTFTGVDVVPWVGREGTWTIDLEVTGAPADGRVEAVIRDRLPDRAAYYESLFGLVGEGRRAAIPGRDVADLPEREDGGRAVSLAVTLRSEEDDRPGWKFLPDGLRPGVYPVEVEVVDAAGTRVGGTVVHLTRVPTGDEAGADAPPLLVAPVLPLDGPPSIEPDGASEMPAGAVERAEAIADGLALTDGMPATLAPRPETVEALDREPGGDEALAALRQAVDGRQVLDAPYVDVPVVAWVAAGLDDELRRQRERGNTVLNGRLGGADSSTFVAASGLSPAAAAELWDVGVRTVVMGPDTVEPRTPTTQPFSIPAGDGRTMHAVEADGGLSIALDRRHDPVLDRAGLAAELALLAPTGTDRRGVVLVAPAAWPRTADDLAGVAEVLDDPLAPVRVGTVADLVASVPAGPPRALRPVLPLDLGDQPTLLGYARARLGAYLSMTGPGDPEVTALDQRLLLSGSATLDADTRSRYVSSVLSTVAARLAAVEAPPRQTITVTSSDGEVPLTLRNQLDRPVQVQVVLDADTRIEFPDGDTTLHVLQPGTNRIPLAIHARAPGDTAVDITVRTPDGSEQLDQVRYTVRSTAISGLGLFLSVGAAAFLLLWWFRHWRRTRRARRARPDPGVGAAAL